MQRALQPEQQADGTRRTCAAHRDAVGRSRRRAIELPAPRRRRGSAPARTTAVGPTPRPCAGRSRTRRRRRRSRRRPAARPGRSRPIASAMPTSSSASAVSVGVGSPRLVRWLSVREVVKPSAPASIASAASSRHRRDVVGGRRLAVGAALAHHVQAQRAVRDLGGDVDVERARVERVQELGERLPVHVRPSSSTAPGMSSTPSISSMSRSWSAGRTGAKPTPQLPSDHGGDAVPATTGSALAPRRLAVVVGVDVDEARA